jgi:hypothetical protein
MNRRKTKFIRPDMQLKVIFITFFVASFVLLIDFQLCLSGLWSLSTRVGGTAAVDLALEEMRLTLIRKFLVAFGLAIPLSVCVGILYTFRFSGPIHRFKLYFGQLASGRWDARCELREADQLRDVCERINAGVDVLRTQILKDLRLLQDARDVLDRAPAPAEPRASEEIRSLRSRLDVEIAFHEERLGIRKPETSTTAALLVARAATPASPAGTASAATASTALPSSMAPGAIVPASTSSASPAPVASADAPAAAVPAAETAPEKQLEKVI